MRRIPRSLAVSGLIIALICPAAMAQRPARAKGAIPTPRHKLVAARRHAVNPDVPDSFTAIPKQTSMWGNSTYGDCVTAEEAFSKACWSVMAGMPELFIGDQAVIQWARKHGVLNGADLTSVMDAMATDGIQGPDGRTYTDGPYEAVDWTNDDALRSAIFAGPVKIGVAAGQFENIVGSTNGWIGVGMKRDRNEDHCVALCGYGTFDVLCSALGVQVPAKVDPKTRGYLLYTWNTIGVIDQPSLINICGEAWVRSPTTPQQPMPAPTPTPPPPPPTPGPDPTPTPSPTPTPPAPVPTGYTGTLTIQFTAGSISGFALTPASK